MTYDLLKITIITNYLIIIKNTNNKNYQNNNLN